MTKNQNKCWYKIGSPPPAGLKNELLKFLSVNNIVIPAAKTGNESNNKNAVKKTAHTKSGIIFIRNPGVRIFKTSQ